MVMRTSVQVPLRTKLMLLGEMGSAIACTDEDGTTWDWNFYSADDGDEITIDYC